MAYCESFPRDFAASLLGDDPNLPLYLAQVSRVHLSGCTLSASLLGGDPKFPLNSAQVSRVHLSHGSEYGTFVWLSY